ncbi:MAG: hypothetical protein HDT41_03045 [Lachnospiraceae bacterium]|nr:hypothetical protein [Lachnospiraceae bacterium]
MIKDEKQSKKLKIVIFNGVSAILIVLFWFILYCFFENHGWLCTSKEECLCMHQDIDWEELNMYAFCIVYFLIELVNYRFTDLSFLNYAFIQVILDFAIFCTCLEFMERTSWFVPIIGVNGFNVEKTEFKAMIHYPYKYIFAMFFSNIIMAMIHGINIFLKSRKA